MMLNSSLTVAACRQTAGFHALARRGYICLAERRTCCLFDGWRDLAIFANLISRRNKNATKKPHHNKCDAELKKIRPNEIAMGVAGRQM